MHSYSEKDSPFFVDPSVCSSSDNEAVSTAVLRAASDEADWLWGLVVREEVAIDPMATNLVWEKVGGGVTEDKTLWMFDVDGTLCSSNTSDTLHLTAVLWLEKHKPQKVALCTNQGGVGLRYWMEPRTNEGYDDSLIGGNDAGRGCNSGFKRLYAPFQARQFCRLRCLLLFEA